MSCYTEVKKFSKYDVCDGNTKNVNSLKFCNGKKIDIDTIFAGNYSSSL